MIYNALLANGLGGGLNGFQPKIKKLRLRGKCIKEMAFSKRIVSLGVLMWLLLGSCKKQDLMGDCGGGTAFVREVTQVEGRVYLDTAKNQYIVRVLNSFDSHDVGYVCNLPLEFQKEGLAVRFSGRYFEYDKQAFGVAGDKFYYLAVDEIKVK